MAKPTVAIRVNAELYNELLEIADARDVTITQALDIYINRARRLDGRSGTRPKRGKKPAKSASQRAEAGAKAGDQEGSGKRVIKVIPKPGTL
jgi:Lsr2.